MALRFDFPTTSFNTWRRTMAASFHATRILTRRTYRPLLELMEDRRLLATWTVDDDFVGVGCNNSDRRCETIQGAVDAASAGDTIKVKAGTYNENVDVGKKLTITGTGSPTVDPVDTSGIGVSDGATAYGFFLHANDIVIKGFNIQDNSHRRSRRRILRFRKYQRD